MKSFQLFLFTFLISYSTALNLNEICYGILFEAIPHPDDPNLFIGCVQGRGTIFGCENIDDVFDPVTVSCVDPSSLTTTQSTTTVQTTEEPTEEPTEPSTEVPTEPSTEPTTIPPTNPLTTTTTISITTTPGGGNIGVTFVCPTDGSFARIPSSNFCDRYFECFLGVANMRDCPTGLHFDVFTRECIDPAVAFCGSWIRCE